MLLNITRPGFKPLSGKGMAGSSTDVGVDLLRLDESARHFAPQGAAFGIARRSPSGVAASLLDASRLPKFPVTLTFLPLSQIDYLIPYTTIT